MPGGVVRFGEFELDRAAYQLRRKGRVVRVQRIPLDLLFLLVERRGQLVRRKEIRERLWGADVFVDAQSSINTAICKLRQVLRDRAHSPRLIETVPARGYRFIAQPEQPDPTVLTPQSGNEAPERASKMTVAVGSQAGERRRLAVLACDLGVNSSGPVGQRDPEELWETIADYYRAAVDAIEYYGGQVGPYRAADGLLAFFGWPQAHDNNAENAVRAGLAILEEFSRLDGDGPASSHVSPKIGVDSGTVVIGASWAEGGVLGDPPGIARQAQKAAPSGALVITAATYQLVRGLFVTEDWGTRQLGLKRPANLRRVIRPGTTRGRLDAAAADGLTRFVGREDELRRLKDRWEYALGGKGQMVLIVGEPGIGKSRLLRHFHHQMTTPHMWVEGVAADWSRNTAFYTVAQLLQRLVEHLHPPAIEARATQAVDFTAPGRTIGHQQKIAQLEQQLASAGLEPAEAIPLLAPLLNLPIPACYPPLAYSPEQRRRRLLATIADWLLGAARVRPLVVAVEDLHWADPSTLELLDLLVEQGAAARLLLLYTARPEFHAHWMLRAHHTQIALSRLSTDEAREIVDQLAEPQPLPEATAAAVVERSGGVPIFVEELTRMMLEAGPQKLAGREIPATLHDSLMARLDRLGMAKEVAQVGSVVGSEFSYELLRAVHQVAEDNLQHALRTLANADLLHVRGIAPRANYRFQHSLIRDAAYQTVLKHRRKELHRQVAQAIEEQFPTLKTMHPELLAHHWTEADEPDRAIAEWEKAGKAAQARSAFGEALASYREALRILTLIPESPARDARELALRQSALIMLLMLRGNGVPEAIDTAERAIALARKTDSFGQLSGLMINRGFSVLIAGDLAAAETLANEALALAAPEVGSQALWRAHGLQLMVCFFRGDLAAVERHFEAGFQLFDRLKPDDFSSLIAICAFGVASSNAYYLGHIAVARGRQAAMRQMAANQGGQYDIGNVPFLAATFHNLMKEYEKAQATSAHALELAESGQVSALSPHLQIQLGHARAQLGRASEGIALIRRGIAGLLKIGPYPGLASFFTFLAAAQQRVGATGDALESVEQSLKVNPDVLLGRPEALALRGELLLARGQTESAEADFRDSIALSSSMGAKILELRATMSLARMLLATGHRQEALTSLAQIYGSFSDGFDTVDLKDAAALLKQLQT